MKFDVVIIGGGLSGLVCGNLIQASGRKCAIVSAGQNALHFSSGHFGLLDRTPDGKPVSEPAEIVESLPQGHPYSKIGKANFEKYAASVQKMFADWGIKLNEGKYRLTPMGEVAGSWLALEDFTAFADDKTRIGENVVVVNIPGFMDFNAGFIASAIASRGASSRIIDVTVPELAALRKNPSEMRSTNIAKVMDAVCAEEFASQVRAKLSSKDDAVVLPAVFGFKDASVLDKVRRAIGLRVEFVPTMMPSVPGIRTQSLLKKNFEKLGGVLLAGDQVVSAEIEGAEVKSLTTANLGSESLTADEFILASGSFFSKGLVAQSDKVDEPVFGLDVDFLGSRTEWADPDFFKKQAYLGFGVKTDKAFRGIQKGQVLTNLYVAGSICGGCNPLAEGCGAGVSILSAMNIAETILNR